MIVILIIAYVFSATKLEKSAEQVLPGSEGCGGVRRGWEAGERNGPNNIFTYEYVNKAKSFIVRIYFPSTFRVRHL
jgi:hypothetical protein